MLIIFLILIGGSVLLFLFVLFDGLYLINIVVMCLLIVCLVNVFIFVLFLLFSVILICGC